MSQTVVKILPSDVGPEVPLACEYCNCDENCVAFNLLWQPLELWEVRAGMYAAGMYRIACKHKTTGILRDVGGVVDVGDDIVNFIPGNVVQLDTVEKDAEIKKYVLPFLIAGCVIAGGFLIYSIFFKK